MKAVNIKLSLAENVKSFVNIASRYPYDIDLRVGRHVVDGKSILGIFSPGPFSLSPWRFIRTIADDLMDESNRSSSGKNGDKRRAHPL